MKRFGFIILVAVVALSLAGCGKKQESMEEQPMSMENLGTMATTPAQPSEAKVAEVKPQSAQVTAVEQAKLEPLPPSGPYKPSGTEIQTALKNAGYYMGIIDGKVGHQTKKAVEEFQKANGLKADGKVGPKTWALLSAHLNPTPVPAAKKR